MFNDYYGGDPMYLPIIPNWEPLEQKFLHLPEETQLLLLRKGGDTEKGLRNGLSELSMKQ